MSTTRTPDLFARAGQILWLAWVPFVIWFTAKVLIWHLDRFKIAGPQYYSAALVLLPALLLITCVYIWVRQKTLWRHELLALATLSIVALLHYEPRATLACAVFFLGCYTAGNFVARRLHLSLPGPIDRLVVGFGIGCGLLIPTLFVLGLLNLFYPAASLILLLIPAVLLYRDSIACLSDIRALNTYWKNSTELRHPMVGIAVVFGFVAAVCSLMIALAPNITFDTLQVHFPSVQHYARAHSISPIPGVEYSYFPQGGEALWTLLYELAGPPGAQVCSLLFFVSFLIVIFRLARACGAGVAAAITGTIWVGTLPFLHWSGSVVKHDVLLAFFQALALYAFSRWLNTRDFGWIVAGAFFVAQSFGVKHTAIFGGIPLAILFAYAIWKQPQRLKAAALVALVFLCFGTFWAVRTYILTGNPVYPGNTKIAVHGGAAVHGYGRYVKLPWTILFDGVRVFESPLPNPAGILWFAFLPLALVGIRHRGSPGSLIACVVFVVVFLAYWSTILSNIRFAIAPFAVLTILLGGAATHFYNRQKYTVAKASILAAEMYCLLIAAMGIMYIEINPPQLKYFAHRLDKPGYLRSALHTYASLEYLKGAGEQGASVFGVDNCSRWYAPSPWHFECQLCEPECRAQDFAESFARYRPRYVIVPEHDTPAGLIELLNSHGPAVRIYRDESFSIFQLGESGAKSVP